jgi:hypothetical protein
MRLTRSFRGNDYGRNIYSLLKISKPPSGSGGRSPLGRRYLFQPVDKGKILGIVGESGSGKSVTAASHHADSRGLPGKIKPGSSVVFEGEELVGMKESELRKIRGINKIAMIFPGSDDRA